MARDKAFQRAEQKIAEARRSEATYLNLGFSHLTTLPESIGQLTQLQTLDLSENRLTALPESIGRLTQLQTLDLGRNQLTALPESIGQLTQLRKLFLHNNQLTALPESIGQLTQLQTLGLDSNHLTALPESIGQLTQLQGLYLSNNQLTALPESIGQLTQLQTLYLSDNQLTALPESLRTLSRLEELYLHGNDRLGIPVEILGPTWLHVFLHSQTPAAPPTAILDYYFSTRGAQSRQLREVKLVVVGRGGAGKTSLIRRLNGELLNPCNSETHGINISPLMLNCGDGPVTARVWDFGGQHVLHAMHEFFLTARSLYLLVLGDRDDMAERDAAYWLQLIRGYAGTAPVVVALNKSRGRERPMDRREMERKFGPIVAWVPTECAAGFDATIDSLRAALTAAVDAMPEVRHQFPARWWRVKEWLETMEEPWLDFTTYQRRCYELGLTSVQESETLASFLNDLGVITNYRDDKRLRDLLGPAIAIELASIVLRPIWLANGIYAILRANDPSYGHPLARDAMVTAESLERFYEGAENLGLTNAIEYPREKWQVILHWMRLLELAYPVDDLGFTLLVPTLLPVEPPEDCDEPPDADRTRLRYDFEVVPGPLLPRLLVRMFSLIDGDRRWRRGAILGYGAARARVWTTQDERYLCVTAIGGGAGEDGDDRDELLTMIRGTLRELFTEYKNLSVSEQWEHGGQWVPRETLEDFGVLPRDEDGSLRRPDFRPDEPEEVQDE